MRSDRARRARFAASYLLSAILLPPPPLARPELPPSCLGVLGRARASRALRASVRRPQGSHLPHPSSESAEDQGKAQVHLAGKQVAAHRSLGKQATAHRSLSSTVANRRKCCVCWRCPLVPWFQRGRVPQPPPWSYRRLSWHRLAWSFHGSLRAGEPHGTNRPVSNPSCCPNQPEDLGGTAPCRVA